MRSDFILLLVGRLVSAVVALGAIRLATSLLSPEQYGTLALLITFQVFCGLILVNPVGQHINRQAHVWWDDHTLLSRLRSFRRYVVFVGVVGAIGSALWGQLAGHQEVERIVLTAITVFGMVIAATWNATFVPLLNMFGFRAESVLWATVTVSSGLVFSWSLAYWHPSATAWFAGQALGMALGAVGAGYTLHRNGHGDAIDVPHALPIINHHTIRTYCLPLAAATWFMWLLLSGYRLVIGEFWGLALLAYAAVGLGLASQIWGLCETLVMQFLYPFFFRRISLNDATEGSAALSDLFNTLGPVYLVLAGATVLGANLLLKVLVDAQYAAAIGFVLIGAVVECCRVLSNILGNAAQVTRVTSSLILPYSAGAVTAILAVVTAGYLDADIIWAGAGVALGGIVLLIIMAWRMNRDVSIKLDVWRWLGGFATLLLLILTAWWVQLPVDTIEQKIFSMLVVSVCSGSMIIALLWNNPALLRLLSTKLRKEEEILQ